MAQGQVLIRVSLSTQNTQDLLTRVLRQFLICGLSGLENKSSKLKEICHELLQKADEEDGKAKLYNDFIHLDVTLLRGPE